MISRATILSIGKHNVLIFIITNPLEFAFIQDSGTNDEGGYEIVEYTYGDVNGDGKIDLVDIAAIENGILGVEGYPIEPVMDINRDGYVNEEDMDDLYENIFEINS